MSIPAVTRSVLLVGALNGLGYGLVFPVAALYGERAGLSPTWITLLIGLHPLMRLLSGRWWGRLADTHGRRPVLLAGVALQAVGHLVFGLAGGPFGLGVGRLLTGLGCGEAVAAMAVVADTSPPEDRAKALGMFRAATGLGMLAGPILGGALGLGGLSWPGLGAAVVCAASFGMVWAKLPETRPASFTSPSPHAVPAPALAVASAAAASLALAECIVPLAVEHVLVPTLSDPWITDPADLALVLSVGVILAWGLTTAVFDGALSARVVDRFGETATLRAGLVLWALAFALTPPVYRLGVLPGALAVAGTAIPVSLTGVSLAAWISRRAGPDAQGSATGAAQSAIALGEFVGPALAGGLFARWYGLPYETGAALLVGAALLSAFLPAISPERSARLV